MPDFWYTTDRNQVRRSLAAIDAKAKRRSAATEPAGPVSGPVRGGPAR